MLYEVITNGRYLPPKEAIEQNNSHFVNHWGRNQKRKRNAQWYTRFNKTQKERDGRAGAKWRNNAQRCSHNVARKGFFAFECFAGAFGRKKCTNNTHKKDNDCEQNHYFGKLRITSYNVCYTKLLRHRNYFRFTGVQKYLFKCL